jgi:hypothetical protein
MKFEGNSHVPIEVLYWQFPGRNEESHKKPLLE